MTFLEPVRRNLTQKAPRVEGLDELRGLAIASVLLSHFFGIGKTYSHLGAAAVDFFFVLSGFLVARMLTDPKHPMATRDFYVRRALRILPLYLVVVCSCLSLDWVQGDSVKSGPLYFVFLQNLLHEGNEAIRGGLLPPTLHPIAGLGPLWSLAVQENFYLFFPLLLWVCPRSRLASVVAALGVVGIALKSWATMPELSASLYTNPFETWLRMQYLVLGVLLALPGTSFHLAGLFLFWSVVVAAAGGPYLEPVAGLAMVALIARCQNGRPPLRSRLWAQIGTLSYGLYLLHTPILIAIRRVLGPTSGLGTAACLVLFLSLTMLMARLSYSYLERPFLRLRPRSDYEAPAATGSGQPEIRSSAATN